MTPAVTRSQTQHVGFSRDPTTPAGMIMLMARKDGIEDELEEEMCPVELPTCPVSELDTPKHVDEASGGPHARHWRTAMDAELTDIAGLELLVMCLGSDGSSSSKSKS